MRRHGFGKRNIAGRYSKDAKVLSVSERIVRRRR